MVKRRSFALIAMSAWIGAPGMLGAHDVAIEPVVEMFLQPQGEQLIVLLRLPTAVLADAGLPRLANGNLDVPALDKPLRLVAADVADNLEVRQADVTLPRPRATALLSPSSDASFATFSRALTHLRAGRPPLDPPLAEPEAFVDLELAYATRAEEGRFSARLNGFRAQGQGVRTVAHYVLPSGQRTLSVAGPPERVIFDPGATDVVKQSIARGLQGLVGGGDHVLFLLCLIVPVRRGRTVAALFAAGALGQVAAGALFARAPLPAASLAVVEVIAASAIVIASMQNIADARLRWVRLLVLGFGVLSGFTFGHNISIASQVAGAHVVLAAFVFLLVMELGQLWIGAVLWMIRRWLDERGLSDRLATVVFSALIAHSAVHRVLERGQALAPSFGRVLVVLTLGWAGAILVVGLVEALAGRAQPLGDARAGGSTSAS